MQAQRPEPYPPHDAPALDAVRVAAQAVRAAGDAVLAVDRGGHVILWNKGAERMFGWSADEVIGRSAGVLLPEDRKQEFDRVVRALLGSGEPAAMETFRLHKSGEQLPVSCRMSPLVDDEGHTYGASAIVRDNSRELALRNQLQQARELAEARFIQSAVAQASMNPDGVLIAVNPRLCELGGYDEHQLLGRPVTEFLAEEDREDAAAGLQRMSSGELVRDQQHRRLQHAGGALLDCQVSIFAITAPTGQVLRLEAVLEDTTATLAAQRAVLASEARWQSLALHSADVGFLADAHASVMFASASVTAQFGYAPGDLLGVDGFSFFHPEDVARVRASWQQVLHEPDSTLTVKARVRHADGTWRWVEDTISNRLSVPGIDAMVANIVDITDRHSAENVLQGIAGRDELTGLPTRAPLITAIDAVLHDGRADAAVAILDIDGFKVVNSRHGQRVGDATLASLAQRLRNYGDEVKVAARLGGDRFAVLLGASGDGQALSRQVALVQKALAEPTRTSEGDVAVTVTAGVGYGVARDSSALLAAAEAALGEAKAASRGSVVVRPAHSESNAMRRALLVDDLRRGLGAGEIVVRYQPVVSLRTEQVIGAEALVRWQHPDHGLLSPAAFIDAAEDSGLIVPLGHEVLREACAAAARWAHAGAPGGPFQVALNLSAKQLIAPDVVEVIERALQASGASPRNLMLEMTESAVMADVAATSRTLLKLRQLGVSIAVDDFGTGYSSLTYLKRFPVTCVKVDRTFVRGLGTDQHDAAIVSSVISLARALDLDCIAEGIETDEQRLVLHALGCELGQGFLWAPALTLSEFDSLLALGRERKVARPQAAATRRRARRSGPVTTNEEALTRIVSMHQEGSSLHTIAASLNADQIRTAVGKRWSSRTVAQALAVHARPKSAPPPT